jgi:hypothetical protein
MPFYGRYRNVLNDQDNEEDAHFRISRAIQKTTGPT